MGKKREEITEGTRASRANKSLPSLSSRSGSSAAKDHHFSFTANTSKLQIIILCKLSLMHTNNTIINYLKVQSIVQTNDKK